MKKLQKFALLGVIALAGSMSFTSCSSDDDPAIGPDGTRLGIKTEFSLVIPNKDKATTRMSDADAQVSTSLTRTMDKLYLIPYGAYTATPGTPIGSITPLNIAAAATTAANAPTNETHYLFNDVDVPIGTGMFVAYITTQAGANDSLIDPDTDEAPDFTATTFTAGLEAYGSEKSETILNALTAIATVEGWSTTDNDGMKDLYTRFTSLKSGSYNKANDLINDLNTTLENNTDDLSVAIKNAITANSIASASSFPENLPEGAIAIVWDAQENKFIDANEGTADNVGVGIDAQDRDKYVKPASLVFRVQSHVATALTSQASNYTSANSWEDILEGYELNSTVKVNTVSTALQDTPLQYAVGRLETKIALTENFQANFNDTVKVYDTDGVTVLSQQITPLEIGEGFEMTGVIIGGQNSVQWDFTPTGTENWAIYDGNMPSTLTATSATATAANSTLVLETAADTSVKVAIQLVNKTGQDINTKNGVIKDGACFYLVGTLDPANPASGTAPDNKVFKQDYVTTVTFTISPYGIFNYATDVIPDLTKDKLELGLSVDLTWEDAATYEITYE